MTRASTNEDVTRLKAEQWLTCLPVCAEVIDEVPASWATAIDVQPLHGQVRQQRRYILERHEQIRRRVIREERRVEEFVDVHFQLDRQSEAASTRLRHLHLYVLWERGRSPEWVWQGRKIKEHAITYDSSLPYNSDVQTYFLPLATFIQCSDSQTGAVRPFLEGNEVVTTSSYSLDWTARHKRLGN